MFTIEDKEGHAWIEIRRNPCSGDSSFSGLTPQSCHIRLTNRACYTDNPIGDLRDFLVLHDYYLQRIFRLDICYDFEEFDTHDKPAKFARRYFKGIFRKINQCKVHAYGNDAWADFEWESISWGNPKSMVSTKLYNKTKELKGNGWKKPYIIWHWWQCGLIDDPTKVTKRDKDGKQKEVEIWRIEFSLRSPARTWIKIEDTSGKKIEKKKIPHTLSMFDARDKLWQRFQDLAHHYFHFKIKEYKDPVGGVTAFALKQSPIPPDSKLKRKDLCQDKVLFYWDKDKEFLKVNQLPKDSKPDRTDEILKKHLQVYKNQQVEPNVVTACNLILDKLNDSDIKRLLPHYSNEDFEVIKKALAVKSTHPEMDILEIFRHIADNNLEGEIW